MSNDGLSPVGRAVSYLPRPLIAPVFFLLALFVGVPVAVCGVTLRIVRDFPRMYREGVRMILRAKARRREAHERSGGMSW